MTRDAIYYIFVEKKKKRRGLTQRTTLSYLESLMPKDTMMLHSGHIRSLLYVQQRIELRCVTIPSSDL